MCKTCVKASMILDRYRCKHWRARELYASLTLAASVIFFFTLFLSLSTLCTVSFLSLSNSLPIVLLIHKLDELVLPLRVSHYDALYPCDILRSSSVHTYVSQFCRAYRRQYLFSFVLARRSVIDLSAILRSFNYLSFKCAHDIRRLHREHYRIARRFCAVFIEIEINGLGGSIYLFGAGRTPAAQSLLSDFRELKIQTRDIGAYWFCKHETRAKTFRISESGVRFYLIRKDIKRGIFFPIFSAQHFSAGCSFVWVAKIKITCRICTPAYR